MSPCLASQRENTELQSPTGGALSHSHRQTDTDTNNSISQGRLRGKEQRRGSAGAQQHRRWVQAHNPGSGKCHLPLIDRLISLVRRTLTLTLISLGWSGTRWARGNKPWSYPRKLQRREVTSSTTTWWEYRDETLEHQSRTYPTTTSILVNNQLCFFLFM